MKKPLPITFIIKSFKRHDMVRRLVESIRENGYAEKVIILNDDGEKLEVSDSNTEIIETEFDIGLSAGRNRLVDAVKTEFLLLLDDDFVFVKETKVRPLVKKLRDYDIVAGAVIDKRSKDGILHYEGTFTREGDTLYQNQRSSEPFDYVPNFFAARTKALKRCRWDEELKMGEHMAFFLSHQGKMKIGQDLTCRIFHDHRQTGDYGEYRRRALKYMAMAMRKFGLKRLVYDACLQSHEKLTYTLDESGLYRDGKLVYSERNEPKEISPRERLLFRRGNRWHCRELINIAGRKFSGGEIVPDDFVAMIKG